MTALRVWVGETSKRAGWRAWLGALGFERFSSLCDWDGGGISGGTECLASHRHARSRGLKNDRQEAAHGRSSLI